MAPPDPERPPRRFEKPLCEKTKTQTNKGTGPWIACNQSCTKSYEESGRDQEMPAMSPPGPLFFIRCHMQVFCMPLYEDLG